MERILNYIGGDLVDPQSGKYLENIEPATGKVYGEIPDSAQQDVELAVQAAEEAFLAWSKTSREERSRYMLRIADLIDDNLDATVPLET